MPGIALLGKHWQGWLPSSKARPLSLHCGHYPCWLVLGEPKNRVARLGGVLHFDWSPGTCPEKRSAGVLWLLNRSQSRGLRGLTSMVLQGTRSSWTNTVLQGTRSSWLLILSILRLLIQEEVMEGFPPSLIFRRFSLCVRISICGLSEKGSPKHPIIFKWWVMKH